MAAGGNNIIGIDIGSATLKVIGVRAAQTPSLAFASIANIAKDPADEAVSEEIKRIIRESGFPSKDAVLLFNDESAVVRRAELPAMAAREMAEALKWQVKEMIHFDIASALIDFEVLREVQKEDGAKITEVLFVAAPKESIDKNVRLLKAAGLSVVAVNISPFAVESFFKSRKEAAPAAPFAVINFGNSRTEMSFFRAGALEFVRMIAVGSRDMTELMTAPIVTEKGNVQLSREEAEEIKIRLGITYEEEAIKDKAITSTQVLILMRPVIDRLVKEIRRSIDYYTHEYGEDIKEAYLIGGGSNLKNLDRYLGEDLKIPVKKMDASGFIDASKAGLKPEDLAAVIPLVGACLGYKRPVNLLPHEYRIEKVESVKKGTLRVVTIAAAAVFIALSMLLKLRVDLYASNVRAVKLQRSALSEIKTLQDKIADRIAFLNQAEGSRVSAEYIMKEISNIIPQSVVLNSLQINLSAKTIEIRGVVHEPRGTAENILTKFMEDIEKSAHLRDAQLGSLQSQEGEKKQMCNFDINCLME